MLQREHPGIAISVKTRQAIRTILNNARDVIHELKGGGLLDEAEAGKLESVKHSLPYLLTYKTEINAAKICLVTCLTSKFVTRNGSEIMLRRTRLTNLLFPFRGLTT